MDGVVKIVITGPESSGKSWLSQRLAQKHNTPWAAEHARTYLEKHGPEYDFSTLRKIARGHKEHQQQIIEQARDLVFLDTDLINFKIWSRVVFQKEDPWINEQSRQEADHRYLILFPDLPWEKDSLREHPGQRQYLFNCHLEEVAQSKRPYRIIKGQGEDRFDHALEALNQLLITKG
ncbi:MAG: AAA family ATPase [Owenweeksia sp.]